MALVIIEPIQVCGIIKAPQHYVELLMITREHGIVLLSMRLIKALDELVKCGQLIILGLPQI